MAADRAGVGARLFLLLSQPCRELRDVDDGPFVGAFPDLFLLVPGLHTKLDPALADPDALRAWKVTAIPIGAAARCATLTCVPTVSYPGSSSGRTVSRQVRSMYPIMWGVESTRAPSMPRKLIATSLVTSSFCSPLVPTGMFGIGV